MSTSITMLRLKIDQPDVDRLEALGRLCRRARNAACEDWLLRMRGKPESAKQAGKPAARTIGGVVKQAAEKSESTKVYHAITEAVPELATQVAAKIAGQFCSHLAAKVDWRRGGEDGKRMRRKDAILAYEDRPPWASHLTIELPCKTTTVTFTDELTVAFSAQRCVTDTVKIATGRVPAGMKLLIRRVLGGELKLSDSTLAVRDNVWYWMLPIQSTAEEIDTDKSADLWPQIPEDDPDRVQHRPYRLVIGERLVFIGDGRYLEAQTRRLLLLIKQIGHRYQQRNGAGHGRQKVDGQVRKRRTQLRNIVDEVRRRAIRDVIRACERDGIGTIVWHDPSLPLREKCWWAANKLDWDWTRFANDLKNSAARSGIVVVVEKFKFAEWKERNNATARD